MTQTVKPVADISKHLQASELIAKGLREDSPVMLLFLQALQLGYTLGQQDSQKAG